jgi:lambda family phage portal protein
MLTRLENAIASISPTWGAKRANARAYLDAITDATALYEGAAKTWRTVGLQAGASSANAEIMVSLGRLRDVSRHLRRNNPTATNAVAVISAHTIGAGIQPAFTLNGASKRLKSKFDTLVRAHLETTAIDYDQRNTNAGLQKLIDETIVESGEALIVRYVPPSNLKLPVPLQVRVLEPDYLDATKSGTMPSGNVAFEGIEIDRNGRRVAYWIFDEHPGGGLNWKLPQSRRVDAADVRHVYRQDRPGQMRGIPWCAPVVLQLDDNKNLKDVERMRYKVAACFAVFFEGNGDANLGQAVSTKKTNAGNIVERLEPGLMQRLPNGVTAKMATPPAVVGFPDFVKLTDHEIAAGYGVPYELLTGDLREVSFISGRLGMLQFNRNIDAWRWHMMIPHACESIARWFVEAAQITLGTALDPTIKHTPPRREMVEPAKEVPAMRDAIRSGLSSRAEEVRSLGLDPTELDKEQAAGNTETDKLGLKYDSDGRMPLNWKPTPPEKADG